MIIKSRRSAIIILIFLFVGILLCLRWIYPERSITYTGPRAILDSVFSLGLLVLVLLFAGGLGWKILERFSLQSLTLIEQTVLSLAVGLGVMAYGILLLGLFGLLRTWAIAAWLALIVLFTLFEWSDIGAHVPQTASRAIKMWKQVSFPKKIFLILVGLILLLTLIQALTPPWDYDGLMYHLAGPSKFLESGRIYPLPDMWGANGPFTIEMLFTIGLAFGSDNFAKLIHLSYAVLLVLATFTFGQRYIRPSGGWIAAAILLGIPILPVWASLAYADMAWAAYEFLSVYALILWQEKKEKSYLVLSGLLMGFALGSKYLALGGLAVLGVVIIFISWKDGWRRIISNGLLFGGTAVLVGSPWYLKNWIWAGNPVYPLYFGGLGWPAERVNWLMEYLKSFGTGHTVWDYILLPVNIYLNHAQFATFNGSIEIPSLLFPLVVLFPFTMKRVNKLLIILSAISAVWFLLWSFSSTQTRFLLPIFPNLSIITASVFTNLPRFSFLTRYMRLITQGVLGGLLTVTLIYASIYFIEIAPYSVVFGAESKDAFLARNVNDYSALRFSQENLPSQRKILMLWDGRSYYCDERCNSDADHSQWTRIVFPDADILSTALRLKKMGVSYLMFSLSDVDFVLQHDPYGRNRLAAKFYIEEFQPACTDIIYQDDWTQLVRITCP